MRGPKTQTLRRLLALLRPDRSRVVAALGAAGVSAAAAAGYAFLVGPLLRAVLVRAPVAGGIAAWQLPLLILGVAVVKSAAQFLQTGWMQSAGQRALARLRSDLYGHLLAVPARELERRASGDVVSRLTADVAQVEFAVTQALTSYVKDGLQLLALLVLCAAIDRRLFVLSFIAVPAAVLPVSRFARSVKRAALGTQASLGRLTALVGEQLRNLPVVQAYGTLRLGRARFDREQAIYLEAMDRSLFVRGAASPTVELLGVAGVAAALAVGTRAVAHEPALASHLLSYLSAVLLMYQPLKSISGTLPLVAQGLAAAERLFELEAIAPPPDVGAGAPPLLRELRFDRVSVAYEPNRDVLSDVSFSVAAGQTVALVGASGAGKTTALLTLLGFVEARAGRILWDGASLPDFRLSSLRTRIAWVSQEPVLFSGTVREAVLLGRPGASDDAVWEALRRAHAEPFVRALPRGLDEQVGERGRRLSGGQRQRLAIARAFLRSPSLLLLDEPTSALDAESEAEVQAGLHALREGRTTLVIAHRLATVREADRLVVLEGGRVVEQGTHAELVQRNGTYARLLRQGVAVEV